MAILSLPKYSWKNLDLEKVVNPETNLIILISWNFFPQNFSDKSHKKL